MTRRLLICLFLAIPALSWARPPSGVLSAQIRSSITQYLAGRAEIPGADAWVGEIRFAAPATVDRSWTIVRVAAAGALRSGRGVSFTISARSPAGAIRDFRASADLSIRVPVVVAARTVSAGAVLGEADVAVRKMDWSGGSTAFLHAPADAVGKRARWQLVAGVPLRSDFLVSPDALKRGEPVVLLAESGAVQVTGKGISLQAGKVGDAVRVRAVSSGKKLSGRLLEGHIVRID